MTFSPITDMPSYLIWYKRIDRLSAEASASDSRVIARTESPMTEQALLEIEKKLDEESGGRYNNVVFSFSRLEE